MIFNLGIQTPLSEVPAGPLPATHAQGMPQQLYSVERTLEERRTVLGAFVITSMVSHSFKAADGLRWSPYLEEYLAHLVHQSTLPQDKILVTQVKMQVMINQVRYSSCNTSSVEIPPYVDALQSQLDDIAGVANGASVAFGDNCK
jgi:hypothetical protein